MGDFLFNLNDSGLNLDSQFGGIPIPRIQNSHHMRPEYQQVEGECGSPAAPLIAPPNSLVSFGTYNSWPTHELMRNVYSPLNCTSPTMPSNLSDIDMEIKMEPNDLEIIDIGRVIIPSSQIEDNLLDDVNFEDLLMTDDLDNSTTCLDPQHSSPAAMTTVHPDEVFGLGRVDSGICSDTSFSPSIVVPHRRFESSSLGSVTASFPPQGVGWKGSFTPTGTLSPYVQNQAQYTNLKEDPSLPPNIFETTLPLVVQETNQQGVKVEEPHPLIHQAEQTSTLHELLNSPVEGGYTTQNQETTLNLFPSEQIPVGQSVPGLPTLLSSSISSRLSSSAPVPNAFEAIWQRREPRQHQLSTGSLAEEIGGSTSSLSTGGGVLSPLPHELTIENDSDDESDIEPYESDSDNDSIRSEEMTASQKRERHFWQYNVQAKGPKGHRVNITRPETNPHRLEQVMDPVFSPSCSMQGIKHSGKARRGDGNDLTPNPKKLVNIGNELDKLNKKINDMTPVSELPTNIRSNSRKEKNKLASRACRLKKKAQHEANKIKLHGLENEHKIMLNLISKVKKDFTKKTEICLASQESMSSSPEECILLGSLQSIPSGSPQLQNNSIHASLHLTNNIEKAWKLKSRYRVAGTTTEFVNKVIDNCRSGSHSGRIDDPSLGLMKPSETSHEHQLYS